MQVDARGWSAPLRLPSAQFEASDAEAGTESGTEASLWVRPESLRLSTGGDAPVWRGAVVRSRWIGPHALVTLQNEAGEQVEIVSSQVLEVGVPQAVELVDIEAARVFAAEPT